MPARVVIRGLWPFLLVGVVWCWDVFSTVEFLVIRLLAGFVTVIWSAFVRVRVDVVRLLLFNAMRAHLCCNQVPLARREGSLTRQPVHPRGASRSCRMRGTAGVNGLSGQEGVPDPPHEGSST